MSRYLTLFTVFMFWSCTNEVTLTVDAEINWHIQSEFNEVVKAVELDGDKVAVIGGASGVPSVIILNKDFKVELYKEFNEYGRGRINDLIQLSTGELLAVGHCMSGIDKKPAIDASGLAIKFNTNGDVLQDYIRDSLPFERFGGVVEASNRDLIINGSTGQTGSGAFTYYRLVLRDMKMVRTKGFHFGSTTYAGGIVQNNQGATLAIIHPYWRSYLDVFSTLITFQRTRDHKPFWVYSSRNKSTHVPWTLNKEQQLPNVGYVLSDDKSHCVLSLAVNDGVSNPGIYFLGVDFSGRMDNSEVFEKFIDIGTYEFFTVDKMIRTANGYLIVGSVGELEGTQMLVLEVDELGNKLWQTELGRASVVQKALFAREYSDGYEVLGYTIDENNEALFTSFKLDSSGKIK